MKGVITLIVDFPEIVDDNIKVEGLYSLCDIIHRGIVTLEAAIVTADGKTVNITANILKEISERA